MSKERPQPPQPETEGFQFTEREKLYDRISHQRLKAILAEEQTSVHEIGLDSNSCGEFLFIHTSRPKQEGRARITFWGAGYHDYRERWLTDEWRWYEAYPNEERDEKQMDKAEVEKAIQERLEEITSHAEKNVQTNRGKFFEALADMTDEDGTLAEIDEIEHLLDEWDDS